MDYKIASDGTSYRIETSEEVIRVLTNAKSSGVRILLDYGDVKTGKSWGEVNDITGYVGRSAGATKIPLLIHNSRSLGGGAILTGCIVKISESKGKRVLYQHPNYSQF